MTDLARELVPRARPPGGERHPYDAGPLAWRLAPMLEALGDDPVYAPLRSYLDRTGGRAMPLAARLAALFDDYQVYRPTCSRPGPPARPPDPAFVHGAWQAALWRRLADDPTLDRAAGLVALAETLRQSETVAALPRRVSVFGALLFPPLYWRVLAEVARHRPVTVYAVTAGPGPTAEPQAHPLLRALAGRTRDFWTVLADLGAPPPVRLADTADAAHVAAPALRQLQDALAHDVVPDPVPLRPGDRSVRVHDCHSATRELEALRDSLLDAFAEIDGLRPSDVLVLVPDLATYAPLVDAVFGAEDAAPGLPGQAGVRLPYHVVGHPHAPALRVVEAFGRALRLHDGRVTASELLDLLGTPVVRRAAGIDEAELPQLRAWVREAGVCWGLDAERRGRFDVPADDLHTWRFGLDRLLLGVMAGDDRLVLGHLPCDAAGLGRRRPAWAAFASGPRPCSPRSTPSTGRRRSTRGPPGWCSFWTACSWPRTPRSWRPSCSCASRPRSWPTSTRSPAAPTRPWGSAPSASTSTGPRGASSSASRRSPAASRSPTRSRSATRPTASSRSWGWATACGRAPRPRPGSTFWRSRRAPATLARARSTSSCSSTPSCRPGTG